MVMRMTKKRFTLDNYSIVENGKVLPYAEVVDLLNQLYDENEDLKFQLDECANHKLFSRRKLEEDNALLRQVNNDFEKLFSETISIADTSQLLETGNYDVKRMFVKELVDSLMSENEQLRQQLANYELAKRNLIKRLDDREKEDFERFFK